MDNKYLRSVAILAILMALLAISGCSHQLEIRNMGSYKSADNIVPTTSKTVGVIPSYANFYDQVIINGVVDHLRRYSKEVIVPYSKTSERKVDLLAKVDLRSEHYGNGFNFIVDWPGSLILTPAWRGYEYDVRYNFSIGLEDGHNGKTLEKFNLPIRLDIRHADLNRTWLAGVGWLFWSIPTFIGGIFHTEYDDYLTPQLTLTVAAPLGDYVAREMVKRIQGQSDRLANPAAAAEDGGKRPAVENALRELQKLHKDGLITLEEYERKRKSIIDKI